MLSDDMVLNALLNTKSVTEAATTLDCSRQTIYSRLNDPEFQQLVDEARWTAMEMGLARLQHEVPASVALLIEQRDDTTLAPKVRQVAAVHIIRQGQRLADLLVNKLEKQEG
jgi:hypothetical protein